MAGGLNDITAKAAADTICSTLGITDTAAITKWENLMKDIYASLLTDIIITIAATSIATTGGATSQSGPPLPLPLHPNP